MLKMNQRGQAFSVFKLLIAAVVAGAILLILLQTLQVLPNIGSQSPNNVASNAVKSQFNEIGLPRFIDNVTFANGDSLVAKTIADQSRTLDDERVCVSVSSDAPNYDEFDIDTSPGRIVLYKGSFSQKTRLLVLCDRGDEIEDDLDEFGFSDDFDIPIGECDNRLLDTSNRACVVFVVPDA